MEHNREPRNKPHLYVQLIFDKGSKTYNGVKIVYSINGIGKIGQTHAKNEIRPPSYTILKNKLNMD